MNHNPKHDKIRDLGFYIPEAFRFYSIKNEYLTPVLFVLSLIVLFAGEYIPFPGTLSTLKGFSIYIRLTIVNGLFLLYLSAYLKDLRGEKYSLREIIFPERRKLLNIFVLSIINLFLFLTSITVIFLVPAVIIYLMIIFSSSYVLDKNSSVIQALIDSKSATSGHKMQILNLISKFLFPVTVLFLLTLMMAGSSNKVLIFPFVLSFAYTVAMMMFQRIIALIYCGFETSDDCLR